MAVLIHWKADFLSQITKVHDIQARLTSSLIAVSVKQHFVDKLLKGLRRVKLDGRPVRRCARLSKVEEIEKIEENKKLQSGKMQSKSERGFLSTAVATNCDNVDEVKKHKKKISKELKKQQHAEEDKQQPEKNPVEKENVSEQFRERSHSLPERDKCRLSPKQFFKQGRLYHQKMAGMFLSEGSAATSSPVDVDDIIDTLAVKFDDTVRLRVGESCHLKGKKITENGKNIAKIGDTGADDDESDGCVLLARGPIGMHMERNVYTTPYPYAERRVARQSYSQACNYPYSPPVDYTQDAFIQEPPQQNLNDLVYLIKSSPCPSNNNSNNNNNNNNLVPQVDDSVRQIAQYEQSWLPPPAIDQYCLEPTTYLTPAKQDLLSINIGQRQQQPQLDYSAQNLVGLPSRLTQMVAESPFSDYGDSPLQSTESSGCGSNLDGYCIEEIIKRTPPVDEEKQLPEGLSDFILKYSRQYQNQSQSQQSGDGSKDWIPSNEPTPKFTIDYELSPGTSNTVGLSSSPDSVDSPGAAIIVRQRQRSAADDQQSQQHLQQNLQHRPSPASSGIVDWCSTSTPESVRDANSVGGPRHRLRELITETELDTAWAWALKYEMTSPGKLYQRDVDGDSYLHIAVWNQNLARIYALTEVMMKTKDPILPAPFDLPNASNETPLYLAVQKHLTMVAAYFVDCGADVNVIANNSDGGTPLHYAVAHGMSEMVEVLASSDKVDLNIKNNSGLTPLLVAVKTDGSILDDKSQTTVQNRRIIRFLLQHNADPFCQDMNGKTIIHYCVEKLDADLLESDGMSPLEQLSFEPLTSLARCEKNCIELSDQILLTLIKNGAEGGAV
ncbi:NF-kappa-B inhibitor zeta [Trichinella pseudospiralis]|uniref:NF-kappa-B inhibitor zeta n=1 Tax=Trichinella pseudospiralis TaxID=6337 RepID=A0A0V1EXR4_TRIPS|nr:NF-kappa-B inhibitor zeta [Trichinella pseudospiralis]